MIVTYPNDIERKIIQAASPDNFAQFLNESYANENCLSCNYPKLYFPLMTFALLVASDGSVNNDITPLDPTEYVEFNYIGTPLEYKNENLHNYEFRITCRRCGFIHHYSAYVFMEWYGKKERKNDE